MKNIFNKIITGNVFRISFIALSLLLLLLVVLLLQLRNPAPATSVASVVSGSICGCKDSDFVKASGVAGRAAKRMKRTPAGGSNALQYLLDQSCKNKVNPRIALAQIAHESKGNHNAVGDRNISKGPSCGYAQILRLNWPKIGAPSCSFLKKPKNGVDSYFKFYKIVNRCNPSRFRCVRRYNGSGPRAQAYARKVFSIARTLSGIKCNSGGRSRGNDFNGSGSNNMAKSSSNNALASLLTDGVPALDDYYTEIGREQARYVNRGGLHKRHWNNSLFGYHNWDFYDPEWSVTQQLLILYTCSKQTSCLPLLRQQQQRVIAGEQYAIDFTSLHAHLPQTIRQRIARFPKDFKLPIAIDGQSAHWAGTKWDKCLGDCNTNQGSQERDIACLRVPFLSVADRRLCRGKIPSFRRSCSLPALTSCADDGLANESWIDVDKVWQQYQHEQQAAMDG